jgi:hypothetical protein
MKATMVSPEIARTARRIASALASDPSLGRDEDRLAALIRDELEVVSKLSRIPSCLRDHRLSARLTCGNPGQDRYGAIDTLLNS